MFRMSRSVWSAPYSGAFIVSFHLRCGPGTKSSVRSAMFIVTAHDEPLAKLRRSGMFLGLRRRAESQSRIETCRSYGAWLNFGGLLTINMALLTKKA